MGRRINWLDKIMGATEPPVEYHIIMQVYASNEVHLGHVPATYYSPEEAIKAFKQICETMVEKRNNEGYNVTVPETIEVGRIYEILRKDNGDKFVLMYIVKDMD